jgi:hypothetical protein
MRILFSIFISIGLVYMLFSCAPTRVVRPLAAKEVQVGVNLGGPIIDFAGLKMPIPFTSVYGAYGLTDTRTLFGGLHTTSLAAGVGQIDVGITQNIWRNKGWGLSASPVFNMMYGYKSFRFYPELDINAYKEYGEKRHFAYFSLANWFVLAGKKAHDVKQTTHYIPSFAVGNTFNRPKMNYILELKWMAPFTDNSKVVVNYNGVGKNGAMGCYFGIARKF